ncbi:MAG: hypothetical protein QXD70_03465 [Candidatus Bathyarchaeia archaeon]
MTHLQIPRRGWHNGERFSRSAERCRLETLVGRALGWFPPLFNLAHDLI